MLKILKGINTAIAVVSAVGSTFGVMYKTFKWFEKKHGNKNKKEDYSRPVIKGI